MSEASNPVDGATPQGPSDEVTDPQALRALGFVQMLIEKMAMDAEVTLAPTPTGGAEEAVRALVALGFSAPEADDAVRRALADGHVAESAALVRRALQSLAPKGGR